MSDNSVPRVPPRPQRVLHRHRPWRNSGSGSRPGSGRSCARCSASWWRGVSSLRPGRGWSMSRV